MEPEMLDDGARMPRWNITPEALYVLEDVFRMQPFPPIMMREKLAKSLDVTPRQVQIWFQNRRQRARHTQFKPTGAQPVDGGDGMPGIGHHAVHHERPMQHQWCEQQQQQWHVQAVPQQHYSAYPIEYGLAGVHYVAQADGARGRQHAPPQSAQHQHQQHLLQQAQAQQAHMGLGPGAPQPMYALSPPLLSMHHYQQQRAPQQPPYINPAASGRQAGQHDGSAQPQPQPQLVGMCVPMAAQPGPRGLAQLGNNGLGANCASMPLASIASPAESPLFANRFSAVRAVPMANGTHFPAGYPHAALAPAPQMVAQQPVFYTTVPPSPRFGPPSAQQQPQPLQPGGAPQLGQPMRRHSGESYPVSYGYEQSPHGAPPQPLPIQVLHAQPQTQYAAAPQQQPQQQQHAGGWQYAQPQQQPQPMQASPQMQQQQHLPASPPGWHYGAQQQPPPQLAGACAGGWHYAQPQQPSQPPNELAYSSGGWQCGASAHNTDDSQLAPRQAIPSAVAHSLGGGAADRHAAEEDAQTGGGWAQGAWGQGGSAPGSVAPPAEFESGAWTSPALISDAAAHNKDNTNATAPPPQPQQQQSASYPAWVPDGGQPHVAQAVPELSVEAQNLGRFAAGTAATPGDVSNSGGSNGGGNGNGAHAHAAYEYS